MTEGLVRLGHLVGVFLALDGGAEVVGGVHQLVGQLLGHRLAGAGPGVADDPASGQRGAAGRTDLDGHLGGGAADTLGLDLQGRGGVAEGVLKRLQRVGTPGALLDDVEGVVNDPLGGALLAPQHQAVDEFCHAPVRVHRVRSDYASLDTCPAWHLALLLALGAILGTALGAVLGAGGVEGAADDVVADTGKVLDATAANQDDRVLLEVVPDSRDVRGDLDSGGQAYSTDFAKSGVGLRRRDRGGAHANAPPLRGALQRGGLGLLDDWLAALADQLVDCGQAIPKVSSRAPLAAPGLGGPPPCV